MFFKHKHLLEELRENGRSARGEILSMTTIGQSSSLRAAWAPDEDLSAGWADCKMKLRVVPTDRTEAPFEASVLTRIHTFKFQGGHVPVWYDPQDHSRVVVDYEADLETMVQGLQALAKTEKDSERASHRYEQRLGLVWTPVAGVLLPLEVLVNQGSGRLEVREGLGAVATEPAQIAVACVRGQAGRILPALSADWFSRHDVHVLLAYGGLPDGADRAAWAGTSAAIAVALVSQVGGHIVRNDVAVTGALGPEGALLPVGALRDRVHAAAKGFAARVVAPVGDEHDSSSIPERDRRDLELVYASTLDDVLRDALARHQLKGFVSPE